MATDLPHTVAIAAAPPAGGSVPLARTSGRGTADDPLRLLLLLRHAGWADAADEPDAAGHAAAVADVMEAELARLAGPPSAEALVGVLDVATGLARKLDAAFSGMVAVLAGPELAAAAIGNVTGWHWSGGAAALLLRPTLLEVEGAPTSLLTGAIGASFAPARVQTTAPRLAPGEAAAFALQTVPVALLASSGPADATSAEDVLQRTLHGLVPPPPLAAAIMPRG